MNLRFSYSSFALLLLALFISACGTAPPATVDNTPTVVFDEGATAPALEPAAPVPVIPTAEPLPEGYPSANPALLVTPTYPPDYPGPPAAMATLDPYPGGMVWITRPVGIQCEDGTDIGYGDLGEAAATLTAAGLRVRNSEMTELMVATVCGSPTSAHYRVQINIEDLDTALSMGWDRGEN